jgi:hypothetical protein
MPNESTVSLHQHLIRLLEDHEKLQDTELAAMDKALNLARLEAEKQYHALNGLKAEYLPKSEYRTSHEAVRTDIASIHKQLDKLDSKITTWGVSILVFVGVLEYLGRFWK